MELEQRDMYAIIFLLFTWVSYEYLFQCETFMLRFNTRSKTTELIFNTIAEACDCVDRHIMQELDLWDSENVLEQYWREIMTYAGF